MTTPDDPRGQSLAELGATLATVARLMLRSAPTTVDLVAAGAPAVAPGRLVGCDAIGALQDADPDAAVTVGDVADLLGLDPSTASRLVADCERDGLVERGVHPQDRRSARLSLTDAGRSVRVAGASVRSQALGDALDGWMTTDVRRATVILARLVTDWTAAAAASKGSV